MARDSDIPRPRPVLRPTPWPEPSPERHIAFRLGLSAESRAAGFLIAKGFRILARRWKSPLGEIDIVARRRHLLVFVEVKARALFVTQPGRSPTVNKRASPRPPRFGLPVIPTKASATSVSTPCWSRPAAFRGTFPRLRRQPVIATTDGPA
jgi:hypothetical protein